MIAPLPSLYAAFFACTPALSADPPELIVRGITSDETPHRVFSILLLASRRFSRWERVTFEAAQGQRHPLALEGLARLGRVRILKLVGCTVDREDVEFLVDDGGCVALESMPRQMHMDFGVAQFFPQIGELHLHRVWTEHEAETICELFAELANAVQRLEVRCDAELPSACGNNICLAIRNTPWAGHIRVRMADVPDEFRAEWLRMVHGVAILTFE